MRAVLEEIEGNLAKFVPDDNHAPILAEASLLPQSYTLGDVFEIHFTAKDSGKIKSISILSGEKEKRLAKMKEKREAIKKKKN